MSNNNNNNNNDNNNSVHPMYKRDVHRDVNTLHAQMMTLINTLNNVCVMIDGNEKSLPDNETTKLLVGIKNEIHSFVSKQHNFAPKTPLTTELAKSTSIKVSNSAETGNSSVKGKGKGKGKSDKIEKNELTMEDINDIID
jgi:hypothetical protein